jgi:hypothetical protein
MRVYNRQVLPAQYATLAAVILAAGGLLACFAGYRLFRFVLGIYGFILGAVVTTSVMGTSHTWTLIIAAVVGGLLGAVLMVAAYFIGVGLVGAGLAALGLNALWHALVHADPPTTVLVIACVLGALGALSIVRYVVVFGTAISGSWTFLIGALALSGDKAAGHAASAGDVWVLYPLDPLPHRWWVTAAWFGLALVGVIVQLATTGKTGARKKT